MNNKSKYHELSPKQQMAILEFIRGNSLSYTEMARKVGITQRTLYRWRHDPKFKEVLEQEAEELKDTVLKTSGMVVSVNALSASLTLDAELVNFAYMGERVYILETEQVKFRKMLKLIQDVLHQFENNFSEIRTLLE
ncbi:MAG: phBC6A51 family helix-turn-helix protein, partial [Thermodesulfobacteriota bacterium]